MARNRTLVRQPGWHVLTFDAELMPSLVKWLSSSLNSESYRVVRVHKQVKVILHNEQDALFVRMKWSHAE